ncbi:pyruvate, water dikinase regulatory protein [Aquimonas sp.]|jgi:regulator of PEP synthase PpsR (kinase-PPPase family)|uniref:posphoenolpyruvate synthetase regulatory kinase/phosphorylase PpsR n=1 Tax=Aquimonas sp. TaxID=1872588 RepID=UPI0037C06646
MSGPRPVFFISDGTGITAETIGHALLTQFEGVNFETQRIAFVDTYDKAQLASERIRQRGAHCGLRPIVVNTVVDGTLTDIIAESGALMLDVFRPFISPLESELAEPRQPRVNKAHAMVDYKAYEARINATNYALTHDDGMDVRYDDADLILVGVSRSGKTPTCLYLALHFGVRAANYPLTEEDLENRELPKRLRPFRKKLFALTIDPERLRQVREARRPGSRYANLEQCKSEVSIAEALYRQENLPVLSTTHTSIEEIASKVMSTLGIERQLY